MNYTTAKLVFSCLFHYKNTSHFTSLHFTSLYFTLLRLSLVSISPEVTFGQFDLSISYHSLSFSRVCQSYIMTDAQSASLSWCQAPIWDPRPIFPPSLFDYF
jgi:hypothetical protein